MTPSEAESLFDEHARSIHSAVYRLTLDAAAADDATQETFVRLLQSPPLVTDNIAAWLKRVAVNFAIDVMRHQARVIALDGKDFEQAAPTEPDVSDEMQRALKRLEPDQRAAVLAIDRDGMVYQEAARLMGVHVNKLRTDLCRGRRALFEMLKEKRIAG
ncbi:ECF RNA polymerase sigma factor SigE [Planctomycetaceae bacterium]|nr:ECF RNA polymerase sigma factor SigE [Planctomycetaceae bacterium]